MAYNLKNRHFLSLRDFSPGEIGFLLKLSADLKAAKYAGTERELLKGKEIALIFEKDSTRTRAGFEVAAHDQGATVTYLGPSGSHIGRKETVKDTARVLGRMFDGIEYRGFGQNVVEELAEYAGVPVWNGLTDEFHPTQILADFLTMQEHAQKPWREIAFTFMGDAANNMGDSLLIGGAKMGMDVRLCAPRACWPDKAIEAEAREIAKETGAQVLISEDVAEATLGADFIYTDVWVSMGEPKETWAERIELLQPYRVTTDVMAGHRQSAHPVPALPARLPQRRDRDGPADRGRVRHLRDGGDRRGVRKRGLGRLRSGREPAAHDQGGARRHAGGLGPCWS